MVIIMKLIVNTKVLLSYQDASVVKEIAEQMFLYPSFKELKVFSQHLIESWPDLMSVEDYSVGLIFIDSDKLAINRRIDKQPILFIEE